MTIEIGWPTMTLGVVLLGSLQYLVSLLVSERLKTALQRESNALLEKLRWDFKVREQAAKVAGYMALARALKAEQDEKDYERANTLSWELAMWLPADVYRSLGKALASPDTTNNPLSVVIAVRKILLGAEAGNLTTDDVIHHAPGIGKNVAG
jgi:hypothetical protein